MMNFVFIVSCILLASLPTSMAHVGAWHRGMYCLKGNNHEVDDRDSTASVQPLWNLTKSDWWFHHVNNCDLFPPVPGDFLEIPSNGSFIIEHAVNRVFTTTVDDPVLGTFVDGQEHPDLGLSDDGKSEGSSCITEPNIHTQNETMAAGTAFAISYQSELSQVTPENLVVFSVLYNTPWRRIAEYQVPNLPPCPPGGCICAWGWVPNGCGEPNMYMQGYKCNVTNADPRNNRVVGTACPPIWCEEDQAGCVKGAKQMIFWNQLDGNNIEVNGYDLAGAPKSPGYNMKVGFANGAQTDIFL